MAVQSNADRLVSVSVQGSIAPPQMPPLPAMPYAFSAEGQPFLLPAYGSIVYNVSVGDSAYGWLADCVHPSVSVKVEDANGNRGLNTLACVGNPVMVMTGNAQRARGVVTGKSGRFSEHVIIHFEQDIREQLAIGDKIVIRAKGVGLEFDDHPDVMLKSCSPELIDALEITTNDAGKLSVPVVGSVPAHLLGAGAGLTSEGGSIHIQTADRAALQDAKLDQLRLGDVVALADYDSSWNHGYLRNAVGIGVIAQGDSPRAGYGPGITLLMTSASGGIAPMITPGVNLTDLILSA
ncbi:MAG: DUF4438 domain-containing protein [Chloroflexi bacterium]|nr:DUF4438 domain-containing protein [Chloroflexota bacterium]